VDPDSLVLSNFDLVTVMPLNERVRNLVTLDGFVRHPGEYELTPGLKLSQLVSSDRLLPEADLDQAELRRVDPNTFRVEVRSISLRNAWAGQEDVELRALDAVTVFSSARFPRSVTLEGEVSRPGTYTIAPGERLSQVLERAGGITDQGSLRAAVFLRASTARREQAIHTEYVHRQRVDLAMQRAQRAQMGDSAGVRALNLTEANLLAALGAQFDPGRVVLDLDPAGKWVGSDRDPVLEDGDRFIVPIEPEVVTVIGSVMNPGSVMSRRGASFNDYLTSAGGPTREADVDRSYVLRANGAAVPRAQARKVEAGDAIVVPGRDRSHDAGRAFMTSARFLLEVAGVTALILAATR
jgi:protein involved in polysaccharide export with SLBB domain